MDILDLLCILVYMLHMDLQNILEYICRNQLYFFLCKLHLNHKETGCRDQRFQLVLRLKKHNNDLKTTWRKIMLTCCYSLTSHKCIPSITWVTFAIWIVVCNIAFGINTTNAWAWVSTVLIETCLVVRTFGIYDTLRFALNVRVSDVVPDTSTGSSASLFRTFSISSTWGRVAGLNNFNWSWGC